MTRLFPLWVTKYLNLQIRCFEFVFILDSWVTIIRLGSTINIIVTHGPLNQINSKLHQTWNIIVSFLFFSSEHKLLGNYS